MSDKLVAAVGSHSMKRLNNALKGLSAEVVREQGSQALINAAVNGELEMVRVLLDKGADPNAVGGGAFRKNPVVKYAAGRGHADVVRLLLERGANVNATDFQGTTALEDAASMNHADVVDVLLKAGATETDKFKEIVARKPDVKARVASTHRMPLIALRTRLLEGGRRRTRRNRRRTTRRR